MSEKYPFSPVEMHHPYSSFVPYLDPDTMYFHYHIIYQNAIDALNRMIEAYPQFKDWTLEELAQSVTRQIPLVPARRLQYYAGAVYNHGLFFSGLDPTRSMLPYGNLLNAINRTYGSFSNFKALFIDAARSVMGSGWVWLNSEGGDKLHIAITSNNELPAVNLLTPVLVLDVWEHAYFLKYPTQTDLYAENWFEVVDWEAAEKRFNQNQ